MYRKMFIIIYFVYFIIPLLNGQHINLNTILKQEQRVVKRIAKTHKPQVHQQGTNISRDNNQQSTSLTNVFQTLKELNHPPVYKRKGNSKVCIIEPNTIDRLLVRGLKAKLKKSSKKTCTKSLTSSRNIPKICNYCCNRLKKHALHNHKKRCPKYCSCNEFSTEIRRKKRQTSDKRSPKPTPYVMTEVELAVLTELNIASIYATTRKIQCMGRGEDTEINTKSMCHMCQYTISLPSNHYPQFHTHFTCGIGDDLGCLSDQGVCSKIVRNQPVIVMDTTSNVFDQDDMYILGLTTCCTCEVMKGSALALFV